MAEINSIPKILLAALLAAGLSACDDIGDSIFGSDDDEVVVEDNDDGNSQDDEQVVYQTVVGKTADGYLVNAKVCGDLNNNSVCDEGEPEATSTEGGNYVIENIDPSIDLSMLRIIVEVIPNETVDEDHPDEVIDQAYTLTSPPGKPEFVSPITTIVDAVMQNDEDISVEEAEEQVKENLGVDEGSDVSLFDDYVEGADDETSEDSEAYEKLHVVAQVVTEVIADSLEDVENNDASLTDENEFAETLNAVVSNVEENLEDIVEVVEIVTDNAQTNEDGITEEIDIAAVILESDEFAMIEDEVSLDAEEVVEKVEEITEEREAESSDVEGLLTERGGFYFLNSHEDMYWTGEQCVAEYEIDYDNFHIVDGVGQLNFWKFNAETQLFEQDDDEGGDDFSFYQLASEGWELAQDTTPQVIDFSADGETLTVSFPGQGARTIVAKEVDLFGKSLSDIDRVDELWAEHMMESTEFPADSTMYVLTMEQLEDGYIVPVFDCQDDALGQLDDSNNCNYIWQLAQAQDMTERENADGTSIEDNRAVTLDDLINREWDGDVESLVMFYAPFGHHYLAMALLENQEGSAVERTILFYEQNYDCYEGMVDESGVAVECEAFFEKGQSEWTLSEQSGQSILTIELHDEFDLDDDFSGVFLTEIGGFVRQGMYLEGGRQWRDEYAINQTAVESVLEGFVAMTDHEVILDDEYCGIFDDEDKNEDPNEQDGNGDDDKNDDGTNDDDSGDNGTGDDHNDDDKEQQGPQPEIEADDVNTELLMGKTYLMETMDEDGIESESIALQFNNNGQVEVTVVETELETDAAGQEFEYKDEFYQVGMWTIDADGMLLIVFEENEESADGQVETITEWKLFKVDGDIGSTLSLIDETSDDESGEVMMFEQLSPASIMASMVLTRTEDDGTTCQITLTFEETTAGNVGNVDGSECPNMEEDDMTSIDFVWDIGEQGQVVIEIDEDSGSADRVQMFENEQGTIYLLIQGTEEYEMDDGSIGVHEFASIEQWQLVPQ